jgi:hypothetical protein
MSSANNASENPFFNTVATSTLPTSGSVFGALKYNTNEKLGWLLGGPSASDVYLYSDLAFDNQNGYYDFVADPTKPLFTYQDTTFADQTLVQVVSQFMTFGDDVIQVSTFEPKEYATQFASQDGMFGLTWLPWNVYGLKNENGIYCVKHYYGNPIYVKCNPLRREVLMIKLYTILKLLGISFGIFAFIKLTIHLIEKKKI